MSQNFSSWKISSISNITKYNLLAWEDICLKIQNCSFVLFVNYFIVFFLLHLFYCFPIISVYLLCICYKIYYKYIKITRIKSQCHKILFSWKISSISNVSKYNLLTWQDINFQFQNLSFVMFTNYIILLLHLFYFFLIISVYFFWLCYKLFYNYIKYPLKLK